MPKESFKITHSFKSFLQNKNADQKLALIKNSSILKLSKRTLKAIEKADRKKNPAAPNE